MRLLLWIGAILLTPGVIGAWAQSVPAREQLAELAPTGRLRVGLVKLPFLMKQDLATKEFKGVAPDLAAEMSRRWGIPLETTIYDNPAAVEAALRDGKVDLTFLAPTPDRRAMMDFTPPFMELEVTLLVPGNSPIAGQSDADKPDRKIVVYEKTAVEGVMRRALRHASLVYVPILGSKQAIALMQAGQADAFADLRFALNEYRNDFPGSRIVEGSYGRNALAIGHPKNRSEAATALREFMLAVLASGFVRDSIARADVTGAVVPSFRKRLFRRIA